MGNQVAVDDLLSAALWNEAVTEWHFSATAPTSPASGEIYLDTNTTYKVRRYNGSGWDQLTLAVEPTTGNFITGTNYINRDGTANQGLTFDASNNANIAGECSSNSFFSWRDSIADDSFTSHTIPAWSMIFCYERGVATSRYAIVGNDYTSGLWEIHSGADMDVNTTSGTLDGTTGTDGKVTIRANDTVFYIENRLGGGKSFATIVFGT